MRTSCRYRYGKTVFAKTGDMKSDRFLDKALDLSHGPSDDANSREIWHVGPER